MGRNAVEAVMMRQPHLYLFMHFLFYNHLDVLLVSKIKSTASSVLRHIGKTIILVAAKGNEGLIIFKSYEK